MWISHTTTLTDACSTQCVWNDFKLTVGNKITDFGTKYSSKLSNNGISFNSKRFGDWWRLPPPQRGTICFLHFYSLWLPTRSTVTSPAIPHWHKAKHKQGTSTKLFSCKKWRRIAKLLFFSLVFLLFKWLKSMYNTNGGLHNNINICSASWGLWQVAYLNRSDILGTLKVGAGLPHRNSGQRCSWGASLWAFTTKTKRNSHTAVKAEEKIFLFLQSHQHPMLGLFTGGLKSKKKRCAILSFPSELKPWPLYIYKQ